MPPWMGPKICTPRSEVASTYLTNIPNSRPTQEHASARATARKARATALGVTRPWSPTPGRAGRAGRGDPRHPSSPRGRVGARAGSGAARVLPGAAAPDGRPAAGPGGRGAAPAGRHPGGGARGAHPVEGAAALAAGAARAGAALGLLGPPEE